MISRVRFMILALAAAGLSACASGPATVPESAVTQVVSTTSFGMCAGYCVTRLEITEHEAVLTRDGRSGRGGAPKPDQRFTTPISASEWQEIARLAAAVDMDALPDVIGCPDCADGGAEGLTIVRGGAEESVSFDHGANVAQAQPLLDRVRALRQRLMPAD